MPLASNLEVIAFRKTNFQLQRKRVAGQNNFTHFGYTLLCQFQTKAKKDAANQCRVRYIGLRSPVFERN